MSEPSGVRTKSQRQREPGEEQADPEMATSAAEQFEGERQPFAGGNDETLQSQQQAPGAEAPIPTRWCMLLLWHEQGRKFRAGQ